MNFIDKNRSWHDYTSYRTSDFCGYNWTRGNGIERIVVNERSSVTFVNAQMAW